MAQQTDTLLLNLAFTTTLFLASWFNLNFFSAIYWFLCLLFIYFVCTQDERHIFNNPTIKYMILTIVSYSFIIVLIHIGLSIQFSITKNTSSFNETLELLGFNKITNDEFSWRNGLSVLFSILNFLVGLVYYHNYVTKSKEIGYHEFIEADITDEDIEKRDYNRVVKRQVLKKLIYFNLLAEICIFFILALNDGIIIAPYMLIFLIFSMAFLFWVNDLTYYKMWRLMVWPLKLWTFALLYTQFFFRINYVTKKIPESLLVIFGYIFKDQTLCYYGLVPMVLLFIVNCLQRSLMNFISEKSWVLRDEDFFFMAHDRKNQTWTEKIFEAFKLHIHSYSIRVYQMVAILWCMIHPSGLMVLVLFCGVCGLFMQKDQFKKVLMILIQLIATFYIFLQMVFNITYFLDNFADSQELFLLGAFKYCLFDQNSLKYKLSNISEYDIVTLRALWFGVDLLIFSVLTRIYFMNRSTHLLLSKLMQLHAESASPLKKQLKKPKLPILVPTMELSQTDQPLIIVQSSEINVPEERSNLTREVPIEETKIEENIQNEEIKQEINDKGLPQLGFDQERSSFLEVSMLKPPKSKPFKSKIMSFLHKIVDGLMLHTAKFILVCLFFASIIIIDGVHFGYFILFLLFSLLKKRVSEKIWKLQMAYSIIVLLSLYIYQVISGYFLSLGEDDKNEWISNYIGVKRYKRILILAYKEHLLLLLTLFIQKIVFESEKYRGLTKQYANDENKEGSFEEGKKKIDIFSKFFLKYGLILCYVSLFFVGFFETPSLLSLMYLIMLAIIIMIELMANNDKKALEALNKIWPLFIVMNFLILKLRYLYQIGYFSTLLKNFIGEETLSLQDIGLDKVKKKINYNLN